MISTAGIHHVTAIATDAQRNVDFYTRVLGLRLVKVTVNFDDPSSYHFYYGDTLGSPGSILTFFAWPAGFRGRTGSGQVGYTALSVPPGSLGWWRHRLEDSGREAEEVMTLFERAVLPFTDHDGLALELVEDADDTRQGWIGTGIQPQYAIRGIHGVTLHETSIAPVSHLLTDEFGFRQTGEEIGRVRFETGAGGAGAIIDVQVLSGRRGTTGPGQVHHVAWRTPSDDTQLNWRATLERSGIGVSPVMERNYFRSIYFREPGGVLFEVATDSPGFATDETTEQLGTALQLPAQYEQVRDQIKNALPPLRLPMIQPMSEDTASSHYAGDNS
jgi:glyoxalase family protein